MHNLIHRKIVCLQQIQKEVRQIHDMREFGIRPILGFTNGCFDLFHAGHANLLSQIRSQIGSMGKLIVAVNSDSSIKANKGQNRPIIPEAQRAYQIACHEAVDWVFIFHETTVEKYLKDFAPDIWFKGGDYQNDCSKLDSGETHAAKIKQTSIRFIPLVEGISSTNIISKIK